MNLHPANDFRVLRVRDMSTMFQFTQAYYARPQLGIPPAQRHDDSSLDQLPDNALEEIQRAFLDGEVHQVISPDLEVAICRTLSQHGSLKKSRDRISAAQPQPGQIVVLTSAFFHVAYDF